MEIIGEIAAIITIGGSIVAIIKKRKEISAIIYWIKSKFRVAIDDKSKLKNIQKDQREAINNSQLLPGERSASFGFLLPDLYIEPIINTHKRPFNDLLSEYIRKQTDDRNIILIGNPGSGKTTTLRRQFCNPLCDNDLALYFTAKEIITHTKKNKPTLLDLLKKKYYVNITSSDFSKFKSKIIYIDGVDEIDPINFDAIFYFCNDLKKYKINFWIGIRTDIYFRYISNSQERSAFFYDVCELADWTSEQSLKFINEYSIKAEKPYIKNKIQTLLDNNNKASSFIENPFKLSLLIFLFSEEKYDVSRISANDYLLYSEFYKQWLIQEKKKGNSTNNQEFIKENHKEIALILYKSKSNIDLKSIYSDTREMNKVLDDSAIIGLLFHNKSIETIIEKFQHETIGEYLVAESIIESIQHNTNINKVMSIIYNSEVNQFVRGAFELMSSKERKVILQKLCQNYENRLKVNDQHSMIIREQLIYYIGRILSVSLSASLSVSSSDTDILKKAYRNESNTISKRAAALSLILLGDESIEQNYIELLLSDLNYDSENRSCQLVYFGDAEGDFHTYKDDGSIGWENTKRSILERLSSNTPRNVRLRLWDIVTLKSFVKNRNISNVTNRNVLVRLWDKVTLKSFVKNRNISNVTNDEIEIIRKTVIDGLNISEKRNKILSREKNELLKCFSKMNNQ